MTAWTDGLSPDRLAIQADRNRRMVYTPPTPAASMEHAAKTLAHIAWVKTMAGDASHQAGWKEYGAQLQQQNQREADRKAVADHQRRELAEAEARKQKRKRKDREQAAATAAAMAGNYHGAIQAEISAILGGGL